MKSAIIIILLSVAALRAQAMPIQQCVSFLSSANHCSRYEGNANAMRAIWVIAFNMQYSIEQLCNHERVLDIFVDKRNLLNPIDNDTIEPHIWVTLHYNEYSCQYFVRESDFLVTKKNCYNTF